MLNSNCGKNNNNNSKHAHMCSYVNSMRQQNVDESLLTYSYGTFAHRNNDAFVLQFLQCVFKLLACDHLKRNREKPSKGNQ